MRIGPQAGIYVRPFLQRAVRSHAGAKRGVHPQGRLTGIATTFWCRFSERRGYSRADIHTSRAAISTLISTCGHYSSSWKVAQEGDTRNVPPGLRLFSATAACRQQQRHVKLAQNRRQATKGAQWEQGCCGNSAVPRLTRALACPSG